MLLLFEFCDFFPAFGQPCAQKNDCHFVPNGKVQNARVFGLYCLCCHRIFVVLAPLEAVTAPWSVQPSSYVDEETTQVGGGKGLTVCLCMRPHEGGRATGQLSHLRRHTQTTAFGTKPLCVCRTTRASVVNGVLRF